MTAHAWFEVVAPLGQGPNLDLARAPEGSITPWYLEVSMARLIENPTVIDCVGTKPKQIREYFGRVNSKDADVSIAHMLSPQGWEEPGQSPEFREFTLVLKGTLLVETKQGTLEVTAGQGVVSAPGEWVRYSTPRAGGAEYVAVCLPAFSPETAHRDE